MFFRFKTIIEEPIPLNQYNSYVNTPHIYYYYLHISRLYLINITVALSHSVVSAFDSLTSANVL